LINFPAPPGGYTLNVREDCRGEGPKPQERNKEAKEEEVAVEAFSIQPSAFSRRISFMAES
jgi:hypothetical protein